MCSDRRICIDRGFRHEVLSEAVSGMAMDREVAVVLGTAPVDQATLNGVNAALRGDDADRLRESDCPTSMASATSMLDAPGMCCKGHFHEEHETTQSLHARSSVRQKAPPGNGATSRIRSRTCGVT